MLVGCRGAAERSAWVQLEVEGFTQATLSERAGAAGVFDFTAARGGYLCSGVVRVRSVPTGTVVKTEQHCRLDERLCARGQADVCAELARMYDFGDPDPTDPVVQNRPRATVFFKLACLHGNASACRTMAYRFALGVGAQTDQKLAAAMFQQACTKGSARACYDLGRRCEEGNGVARDPARAERLFARACWGGIGRACPWAALFDVKATPR